MSNEDTSKRLQEALAIAIRIIESYQFDIQNSQWTGVDLVNVGFCQGEIYRKAIDDIRLRMKGPINGAEEKQSAMG